MQRKMKQLDFYVTKMQISSIFILLSFVFFVSGCTKKTEETADWIPYVEETTKELSVDSLEATSMETVSVEEKYFVHVCGAIEKPGVYEMPKKSRIFEVIEKAGGFTKEADEEFINLAEEIRDGSRIIIPTKEETSKLDQEANKQYGIVSDREEDASALIDLNTADKEVLCSLPGVGDAKAEAIILYRKEHGEFHSIDEIMQIAGIKESLFYKIKDKICVR